MLVTPGYDCAHSVLARYETHLLNTGHKSVAYSTRNRTPALKKKATPLSKFDRILDNVQKRNTLAQNKKFQLYALLL